MSIALIQIKEAHTKKLAGVFRNADFNSEAALAKMNMFLHDVSQAWIEWCDTLKSTALLEESRTDDAGRVRDVLDAWYRQRAQEVFAERLEACLPRVLIFIKRDSGAPPPELALRVMRTRWGSTSPPGRLTLNPKLVQMPKRLVDYVIYHELCHLEEPHHGPGYQALLSRVLPDWQERREALNAFELT